MMSRRIKAIKRQHKSRMRKLAKVRPKVWKRAGLADWGVGGYTVEGYHFYGSYESKELAELAADLIQLEKETPPEE